MIGVPEMLFYVVLAFIGGLLSLLILLLGWLGNKVYVKMEEIARDIKTMASELHGRINDHETRITRIETVEDRCPISQNRRSTDLGQ